jgi:hypothetical protein
MPWMLGGNLDGGEVFNIEPRIEGRSWLGGGWGDGRFAHEYLGVKSVRCMLRLKAHEFALAGSRGLYSCGSGDFLRDESDWRHLTNQRAHSGLSYLLTPPWGETIRRSPDNEA